MYGINIEYSTIRYRRKPMRFRAEGTGG